MAQRSPRRNARTRVTRQNSGQAAWRAQRAAGGSSDAWRQNQQAVVKNSIIGIAAANNGGNSGAAWRGAQARRATHLSLQTAYITPRRAANAAARTLRTLAAPRAAASFIIIVSSARRGAARVSSGGRRKYQSSSIGACDAAASNGDAGIVARHGDMIA